MDYVWLNQGRGEDEKMGFIVWLRSCHPFNNIGNPFFNYQKFEETAVQKNSPIYISIYVKPGYYLKYPWGPFSTKLNPN